MAQMDPLQLAAGAYAAKLWDQDNWREFGRETGTSDILSNHSRLYRSQDFGDPDYPDAALEVLGWVLTQGPDEDSGERGRMDLLADSMPDLPRWIDANGASRTKRLFRNYLAARDISEIPEQWLESRNVFDDAATSSAPTEGGSSTPPWREPQILGPLAAAAKQTFGTRPLQEDNPSPVVPTAPDETERTIFIVHGHDEMALNSVRIYVHRETGIMPISLAEEAGRGATIIEKFEDWGASASYVIVLLTPDDVGQTVAGHAAQNEPNNRARQNVVLELGYFIGKIGRKNIVVLDASVERPSDLAGLSYIEYPGLNWKDSLRVELVAAQLVR
ncbi:TIR domain-containing protein [Rathayibacter sp. Leaf299]|uniref:TIR domain-containing protein n=1 Tax=Rathayibacter sp. Leaf299 TaxID=1736328 RepID=UPI0009E9CBDA|nr:TIR domain-containing protein [Rathayibacter sp. Leaf299]